MLRLLALLALTGCTSLAAPTRAADATRATGHGTHAVVDAVCTQPYVRAKTLGEEEALEEVTRLDALGCPEALAAQTMVSEAHATMVALLTAIRAGQCQATIAAPAPARCDLGRATMALVKASARAVRAAQHLEASR